MQVTIICPTREAKNEVLTGECDMTPDEAGLFRVYMDDHSIFFASADEIVTEPCEAPKPVTVTLNDIEFTIPQMPTWLDIKDAESLLKSTDFTGAYARKQYARFLRQFSIRIPRTYNNRSARAIVAALSRLQPSNVI